MGVNYDLRFDAIVRPFVRPETSPSTITLIAGADANYAQQLAVSLHSALRRIDPERFVAVLIMDGGLGPHNVTHMRAILAAAHPRTRIDFVTPDTRPLKGFHTSARQTSAVWNRLLIPWLLPESINRALYIDADVVVTEDVSPLFDMDMADKAVWAVDDPGEMERLRRDFHWVRFHEDADYFNSGVLLMNLPEWRRQRVSERAIEIVRAHGRLFRWHDQDALNLALAGDWGALPHKWNNRIVGRHHASPDVSDPAAAQGILHFAGRRKPWHPGRQCQKEDVYFAALLATGWHGPLGRLRLRSVRAYEGLKAKIRTLRRRRWNAPEVRPSRG